MVPALRKQFNQHFTQQLYQDYLAALHAKHPGALAFRVAETPVFIDKVFTQKILSACESIVDVITRPDFIQLTQNAVPAVVCLKG